MLRLVFIAATLGCVATYKFYQDEVPNGDRIPHPCKANYLWPGLGHKNELGGGSRNPFGLDFAAAGFKWTVDLCNKDSDSDGKTNGAELGDPKCIWSKGSIPANADGLSHPGVCEPIGSPQCNTTNDWDFCKLEEFKCDAINKPEVEKLTVLVDKSNVPAKETSYMCQHFVMPTDKDYHVIASKPEIDNDIVMHHILIFGCEAGPSYKLNDLNECGMSNGNCQTQLGGWSVGQAGYCQPDNVGVLIGKNSGFSHFMIQLHWNNPQKLATYTDHSGISLYVTPTLRTYSSATFTIGQLNMNIPPKMESYVESATCRSSCTTQNLNGSFFIYSAAVHMHYLGKTGVVEHHRNGKKIGMIVDNTDFSYDRPTQTPHTPPIEFKPGDEMKIKCEYKSTSRTTVTKYGDGTQDEMCYGFISVYPVAAVAKFKTCVDFKDLDLCAAMNNKFESVKIEECNLGKYIKEDMPNIGKQMYMKCNGLNGECSNDCKTYVDTNLNEHACRKGSAKDFLNFMGQRNPMLAKVDRTAEACESSNSSPILGCSLAVLILSQLILV